MRVLFRQFFGLNHSWSIVSQNLARSFLKQKHSVDVFSTNGIHLYPEDLQPNLIGYQEEQKIYGQIPDNNYDLVFSYTALKNAQQYMQHSQNNKLLQWCYEWPLLPETFAKGHLYTDYIIAPSNFAKECFVKSKVPENKVKVIPHGVSFDEFENKTSIYPLKTKKTIKIFVNIGQSHRRKNIEGIFKSYCAAFTKNDDVCLVAKISKNDMKNPFDIDATKVMNYEKQKYGSNAPEIELISSYVNDIGSLYRACDMVFYPSHCEGFGLIPLEGMFAGKVSVCSRYGGMLDYLNEDNSLLVNGTITRAPMNYQYWQPNSQNQHFVPDLNDMIDKLRFAVKNKNVLNQKVIEYREKIRDKYSWDNIATQITSLCK